MFGDGLTSTGRYVQTYGITGAEPAPPEEVAMVGMSERFEMRLDEETLARVDGWRREQEDVPSRAEAMRRLIERGLSRTANVAAELSDGEKLIVMMLRDVYKHLKLRDGEMDPDFLAAVISGGHYWAPTWQLPGLFHGHEDDPEDVRFVVNVLDMWSLLESAYEAMPKKDKEAVEKEAQPFGKRVRFPGFDGNNEGACLGIAQFLVEEMNRFGRFKGRDLNSHAPLESSYRRMLKAFEPMRSVLMGTGLDVAQVMRILNAQRAS